MAQKKTMAYSLNINFPSDQYEALRSYCEEIGGTMGSFVRRAVDARLSEVLTKK